MTVIEELHRMFERYRGRGWYVHDYGFEPDDRAFVHLLCHRDTSRYSKGYGDSFEEAMKNAVNGAELDKPLNNPAHTVPFTGIDRTLDPPPNTQPGSGGFYGLESAHALDCSCVGCLEKVEARARMEAAAAGKTVAQHVADTIAAHVPKPEDKAAWDERLRRLAALKANVDRLMEEQAKPAFVPKPPWQREYLGTWKPDEKGQPSAAQAATAYDRRLEERLAFGRLHWAPEEGE